MLFTYTENQTLSPVTKWESENHLTAQDLDSLLLY